MGLLAIRICFYNRRDILKSLCFCHYRLTDLPPTNSVSVDFKFKQFPNLNGVMSHTAKITFSHIKLWRDSSWTINFLFWSFLWIWRMSTHLGFFGGDFWCCSYGLVVSPHTWIPFQDFVDFYGFGGSPDNHLSSKCFDMFLWIWVVPKHLDPFGGFWGVSMDSRLLTTLQNTA